MFIISKLIDLTGQTFGRLIVIQRDKNTSDNKPTWLCKCECGREVVIRGNNLKSGTKSCGCLLYDKLSTHKNSHTKLYKTWNGIKARCNNPNQKCYIRYGGRGIKICSEWEQNFETFKNWALANGYKEGLTIDRVNNNGDYEPTNCRWITQKGQANNRRTNHVVTYNGKTQTLQQWAREYNIKVGTLWNRIKLGWTIEKTLTNPIRKKSR